MKNLCLLLFHFLLFQFLIAQDISLDTSFGTNGAVITDVSGLSIENVFTCATSDAAGNIYAGGKIGGELDDENFLCFTKYDQNGIIDTSFGVNGTVSTISNAIHGSVNDIFLQDDGKILIIGNLGIEDNEVGGIVMRFNSDGTLDTNYAENGIFTYIASQLTGFRAKILPSNELLILGGIDEQLVLIKLNSAGQLDTSFGNNGIQPNDFQGAEIPTNLVLMDNGKFLVGSITNPNEESGNEFIIIRYNSDGTLDTTFNSVGYLTGTLVENGSIMSLNILLQSDNKIVIQGNTIIPDSGFHIIKLVLQRYTENGILDTTYGQNGANSFTFSYAEFYPSAIIQDDRVIVGGFTVDLIESTAYYSLRRINEDGSMDMNINGFSDEYIYTAVNGYFTNISHFLSMDSMGRILQLGYSALDEGQPIRISTMIRYNVSGNLKVEDIDQSLLSIRLSPNPVNDYFEIRSNIKSNEIVNLEIYSSHGTLVKSIPNYSINSMQKIDIQNLESGVYWIKIKGMGTKDVIKFIKN